MLSLCPYRHSHLADLGPQLTIICDRVQEGARALLEASLDEVVTGDETPQDTTIEAEVAVEVAQPAGDGSGDLKNEVAIYLDRADTALLNGDLFRAHSLLEQACDLDPQPETLTRLARIELFNNNLARTSN